MSTIAIAPGQKPKIKVKDSNKSLAISEIFGSTIQGEGVNAGVPAVFIRTTGCTLACEWCDTVDIWTEGSVFSFEEIFHLMETNKLITELGGGAHLVLTGGSPLLQQTRLTHFLQAFTEMYGFLPYVEVENEAVIEPLPFFAKLVSCWNNSPKLSSSGNARQIRYKPNVLATLSSYTNSWFKFVITQPEDWDEIMDDFIGLQYIRWDQVILMPEAATQKALMERSEMVVKLAIKNGVRFSSRLQVMLWDDKWSV